MNVLTVRPFFGAEENHGMAALRFSDLLRPEDLHEVTWLGFGEVIEIPTQAKFMKQSRGPGAVSVPSSPDSFAVALIANHELVKRGKIELELPVSPQLFKRANKDKVGSAGTKTRRRGRREDE